MKSLLHCFWTGGSFPYSLRSFIIMWVKYLRNSNSEFQLVLWVTGDTYKAISEYLEKGLGNRLNQRG